MKTTVLRYNVMIKKEGKYFVAYVPTLGISDFGQTVDDAQKNVKTAISVHIEGLIKTGSEVPAQDSSDFYISQSQVTVPSNLKFAY
ncbi:MAG: type II toxin-antitoxin system HicB family antitoxin [Patescibacteria group bacterium]